MYQGFLDGVGISRISRKYLMKFDIHDNGGFNIDITKSYDSLLLAPGFVLNVHVKSDLIRLETYFWLKYVRPNPEACFLTQLRYPTPVIAV